uniref:Ig-like domain-containing protein n=1 Tax=Oncorhynchus kisutch TaxID=8019 RepID=A0A8C7JK62_ONCKI
SATFCFRCCLQVEMTPATVTEGQRVTLDCRTVCTLTDNPNPSYIWYKLGQRLTNQNNSLILNPVSSEDAGRYSCAVEGFEDLHSPEETLTVKYGPKNTLASIHLSDEILEGSSVTLTCISDANPPVGKYTWYKKIGAHYQSFSHGNTELQHVFSHIQSSDTGEYYCEARNEMGTDRSESINIDNTPSCRPHYLPREFSSIFIVAVYLPPQTDADTKTTLNKLYRAISKQEKDHPEVMFLMAGCVQLEASQLYVTINSHTEMHTLPHPPLGKSDHNSYTPDSCLQ